MSYIKLDQVPARIKEIRINAGLSQKEFAALAQITQGQISHFEVGRTFPGLETLLLMSKAVGMTLDEFLGESSPSLRPAAPPTRAQKAIWILEEMNFTKPVIDRVRVTLGDFSGRL